ncbi:hypothetical protein LCGC14_1363700 [marine sediment metagenome]|uniref:Uncharacterized protein n=1 Tax=marine sediment metagenome TaxID=412755 RepID=A0A0F9KTF1_9ZZZZ
MGGLIYMIIKDEKNILKYQIENGVEFSELDSGSRDKLISEICRKLLKLEEKFIALNYTTLG